MLIKVIKNAIIFSTVLCIALTSAFLKFASAETPILLDDLNSSPTSINVGSQVSNGSKLFFVASDPVHGYELWVKDGSQSDAHMVKDINPGYAGGMEYSALENSQYRNIFFNGYLYFSANDGSGTGLWVSDGTSNGTQLVAGGVIATNFVVFNNKLFFQGYEPLHGAELWVSDGTTAGTTLLVDINQGQQSSSPDRLTVSNNILYFSAFTDAAGTELWKSDGTAAGTALVKDITQGDLSSSLDLLGSQNGKFLFGVTDESMTTQLWTTDGTDGGTNLFSTLSAPKNTYSSFVAPVGIIGSNLLFVHKSSSGTFSFAADLWATDGSSLGTVKISGLGIDIFGSYFTQGLNGQLLYGNFDSTLWSTDGTVVGAHFVSAVTPNSVGQFTAPILSNSLYFSGFTSESGYEVWRTDATADGTFLVKDLAPGTDSSSPNNFVISNNQVYFSASGPNGNEIYVSDGTDSGTRLLADIAPGLADSSPNALVPLGQSIIFRARTDGYSESMWISDGNVTSLLPGFLIPGTLGSDPSNLIPFSDNLFFQARSNKSPSIWWTINSSNPFSLSDYAGEPAVNSPIIAGNHLYSWAQNSYADYQNGYFGIDLNLFDGTSSSFTKFTSTVVGPTDDPWNIFSLIAVGNKILFSGNDSVSGKTVQYISDGISSGTSIFTPGNIYNTPVFLNGIGYFPGSASDQTPNTLWTTDGTSQGTSEFNTVRVSSNSFTMVSNGSYLYFLGDDGIHGSEIWRTDGTQNGTFMLRDIVSSDHDGAFGSYAPSLFTVVGAKVFFFANDDHNTCELWSTDGTSIGTNIVSQISSSVKDTYTNDGSSLVGSTGSKLVFATNDYINNRTQLWTSDGTVNGTSIVANFNLYTVSNMTSLNGTVYFIADDGMHGSELWKTDGSNAGTALVSDLFSGAIGSDPNQLTNFSNHLYFVADDGVHGRELFSLSQDGTDLCPNDPNKTSPGTCGCGVPDTDANGDGQIDCLASIGSQPTPTANPTQTPTTQPTQAATANPTSKPTTVPTAAPNQAATPVDNTITVSVAGVKMKAAVKTGKVTITLPVLQNVKFNLVLSMKKGKKTTIKKISTTKNSVVVKKLARGKWTIAATAVPTAPNVKVVGEIRSININVK